MIEESLGLVAFAVSRMSAVCARGRLDPEDAFAYGVEGLIQAVDSFDPARGVQFTSFALPRIRGSILDAVRRLDALHRSMRKKVREVQLANVELAHSLGRWPSASELAERTGLRPAEVRTALGPGGSRFISLDKAMASDTQENSHGVDFEDLAEWSDPAALAEGEAVVEVLAQTVRSLPPRDRQIIELRYVRSMSFQKIGEALNVSESRVCRLHKRILASLYEQLSVALYRAA